MGIILIPMPLIWNYVFLYMFMVKLRKFSGRDWALSGPEYPILI